MSSHPISSANRGGFDGSRLRKLQLERARSALSTQEQDEDTKRRDAFRRWRSMNDTTATTTNEQQDAPRSTPNLNSHVKNYGEDRFVYVLPDPQKKREKAAAAFSPSLPFLNRDKEEEEQEYQRNLKYPHGMPRWGPPAKSPPSTPNENRQFASREQTRYNNKDEATKSPYSRTKRRQQKAERQRALQQKAQEQSRLAAARAADNLSPRNNPHKKKQQGLGSRFLLGRPSLLESARIKQAHVLDTPKRGDQTSSLRQTKSLDDPLQQQERKPQCGTPQTPQSVGSFEFLVDRHRYTSQEEMLVETISHDSFADRGGDVVEDDASAVVEELSIDSEVELQEDDHLPVVEGDDETSAGDDVLTHNGDEEGDSWNMDEKDDSDSIAIAEELSIDESVSNVSVSQDSEHAEVSERDEDDVASSPSSSSDSEGIAETPRSSSIPTVILSDPESCSRISDDYSSVIQNNYNERSFEDDATVFFDVEGSLHQPRRTTTTAPTTTTPAPTAKGKDRPFDAKRCRELLAMRNQYLEKEERSSLLSPQAEQRLATTPSLFRAAKESTILELSSRSRWMDQTPIAPSTPVVSPFTAQYASSRREALASMPDDSPGIQPIALHPSIDVLVKPGLASSRNSPWHVRKPTNQKQDENQHDNKTPNQSTSSTKPTGLLDSILKRVQLFLLRCVPVSLLLLKAAWTGHVMQDLLTIEAANLGRTIPPLEAQWYFSSDEVETDDGSCSHDIMLQPYFSVTPSCFSEMPILLVAPPVDKAFETGVPSYFEDVTNSILEEFWDNPLIVKSQPAQPAKTDHLQAMLFACTLNHQTICSDIHEVCCSVPWELLVDEEHFGNETFEESNKRKAPMLQVWGDKLRKHGQKLLEQRMQRREVFKL
ncbi:expressed unknown protein [Seminavis robusta]|uniref:Uncharacterized protein n=1 Tax=Seminavis robusta TaxID=568900 RepID=A0A9N8ES76_9STRA|nr:expressed unknown protein [Seminavis robusta]|eukprot:Sro1451_g273850.1 n/a (881) ;mRNA; r:6948-9590